MERMKGKEGDMEEDSAAFDFADPWNCKKSTRMGV